MAAAAGHSSAVWTEDESDDEIDRLLAEGAAACSPQVPTGTQRGTKRRREGSSPEPEATGHGRKRAALVGGMAGAPGAKQVANSIAAVLQEYNVQAVLHCVQLLGADAAQALLRDTQAIQASGGQSVPPGRRRRTAGGVFFNLLRARVTPEQYKAVFEHNKELFRERTLEKNRRRNARKRAAAAAAAAAAAPAPPSSAQPLPGWMAALATSPPPRPAAATTPGSASSGDGRGEAEEEEGDLDAQLAALEAELGL